MKNVRKLEGRWHVLIESLLILARKNHVFVLINRFDKDFKINPPLQEMHFTKDW